MKLPKGQSESVYRRTDNTMAKGKSTNGQTTIYRKGSSSCSTSDTRRVNSVTNRVISHEREKDREVFTTSGTYSCKVSLWIFNASFNNISVNGEFYLELRGGYWRNRTKSLTSLTTFEWVHIAAARIRTHNFIMQMFGYTMARRGKIIVWWESDAICFALDQNTE